MVVDNLPKLELFSIGEIPVRLDPTFAIVPVWAVLAAASLPLPAAVAFAGVLVIGVFASILVHELGHARAARQFGLPVQEIVVGGFFGIATLGVRPPTLRAATAILLAGPLANVLVYVVLRGLVPPLDIGGLLRGQGTLWSANWVWLHRSLSLLTTINLAMAIINLLPAFPLDGGRLYRLQLSRHFRERSVTRCIAITGLLVGVWMILAGFKYGAGLALLGLFVLIINWAIATDPGLATDL